MTIKIEAELLGPFESPKPRKKRDSIFKESGIYIWTIPWDGRFLTNYVGETGTSFARRLLGTILVSTVFMNQKNS